MIPTYDQFISPLLLTLAKKPDGLATARAVEAVADAKRLTAEDRSQLLPSGLQATFANRIAWAHDRLKRCGLSSSPKRGFWKVTDKGVALATKFPNGLPDSEVDDIAESGNRDYRAALAAGESSGSQNALAAAPIAQATASPSDLIESALRQIHESVSRDLLELIGHATPAFFEQLVLDLLHAMGYGTSREDLQRVGGSGDGGIDGIISLDRLGLEKVFVQAKRWQKPVGSPEVQTFMGALQLQGASKGVFLTTSTFTKDARDAALRARGSIVLVDGTRLAALMIAHGVGVTPKRLEIPKIDSDYFEGE